MGSVDRSQACSSQPQGSDARKSATEAATTCYELLANGVAILTISVAICGFILGPTHFLMKSRCNTASMKGL
jgi:hypothetical protein